MKTILKLIALAAGVMMLLFGAYMGFAWWSVDSHPVSKRKIGKLHAGMPATEVGRILGRPWKTERLDAGGFAWVYGSRLQWYYFTVKFAGSSNVVEFGEDD